jgi:hypothetical protein
MLIQELLKIVESQTDPAVARFKQMIAGKNSAIINLSIIHAQRGNGASTLDGAIETFPSVEAMVEFLAKDRDGLEGEGEARVLRGGVSESDKKILGWPSDRGDVDIDNPEDVELFTKLSLALNPRAFLKLECVKDTHDNGDIDGDNYDWQLLIVNRKRTENMLGIEDFIEEESYDEDSYDDDDEK